MEVPEIEGGGGGFLPGELTYLAYSSPPQTHNLFYRWSPIEVGKPKQQQSLKNSCRLLSNSCLYELNKCTVFQQKPSQHSFKIASRQGALLLVPGLLAVAKSWGSEGQPTAKARDFLRRMPQGCRVLGQRFFFHNGLADSPPSGRSKARFLCLQCACFRFLSRHSGHKIGRDSGLESRLCCFEFLSRSV